MDKNTCHAFSLALKGFSSQGFIKEQQSQSHEKVNTAPAHNLISLPSLASLVNDTAQRSLPIAIVLLAVNDIRAYLSDESLPIHFQEFFY